MKKMNKTEKTRSSKNIKKIWDAWDYDCSHESTITVTYRDLEGFVNTEEVKDVRWDGAVITESGNFLWSDLEYIMDVTIA